MADRFTETGEVMEKRLSLGAELVLISLAEVPPVQRREVGAGMECREDEAAFGMHRPMPFPQRCQGGENVGEREIAHESIQRAGLEWKGVGPIGLNPSNGEWRHGRQPADKAAGKFPL